MFNTWGSGAADISREGERRGRERYLRDRVRSRCERASERLRPPGGTALNQGSVVGSGFSGAFKCFRSCLECRKRLSETKAETAFLIGSRSWPPPDTPSLPLSLTPFFPLSRSFSLLLPSLLRFLCLGFFRACYSAYLSLSFSLATIPPTLTHPSLDDGVAF